MTARLVGRAAGPRLRSTPVSLGTLLAGGRAGSGRAWGPSRGCPPSRPPRTPTLPISTWLARSHRSGSSPRPDPPFWPLILGAKKTRFFGPLRCKVQGGWGGSAHYPDPTAQSASASSARRPPRAPPGRQDARGPVQRGAARAVLRLLRRASGRLAPPGRLAGEAGSGPAGRSAGCARLAAPRSAAHPPRL